MIPLLGAHDFPYIFNQSVASWFNIPLVWSPQSHDSLGIFTLSTLWTWPYGLLYGLGAKLGLDFSLLTVLLGILPAIYLSWFSMGRLLKFFDLSNPAKRMGQFMYAANTYVLMLIDGGQLSLALGYSLLPLALAYLDSRYIFALIVAIISFLDIRYLFILCIPISLKLLFDISSFRRYLTTGIVTSVLVLGLHGYWLLPAAMTRGPSLPETYTRSSQVSSLNFAKLTHSFMLLQPHWPKNIFGQIPSIPPYFLLIPVFGFLPLIIYKKNKTVGFYSILAVVTIFLAKGSNPPFGEMYIWAFSHVPGFSLFRDSTKFFSLLAISYGVLISFTLHFVYKRFRRGFYIIVIYLILLLHPLLGGEATGLLSLARNQASYLDAANFLNNDKSYGSIVWVPSKPPLGYSSPTHLSMDAKSLLGKRPFATGVVGNYELLNFLRDASHSGELLDISSVKYLAISAIDPERDSLKPEDIKYHKVFTDQLASLPWIVSRRDFGPVTLLETQNHQDVFFAPHSTKFVVGADDIYPQNTPLSLNGFIFAENYPGLLSRMREFPQSSLYLNRKNELDVVAALIPASNFNSPAKVLDFSPNGTGWWKRDASDTISWIDFLEQKYQLHNQDFDYGSSWSVSEGSHEMTVILNGCEINCTLLARVMVSPRGGEINFLSNGKNIGKISTQNQQISQINRTLSGETLTYDRAEFLWFEVGDLPSSRLVKMSTSGDINVVNSLVTIPSDSLSQLKLTAKALLDNQTSKKNIRPSITFIKRNPAHYKISVKDISGPTTIAFVQNYDPLWSLDGQSPVPLYDFINGFTVPGPGEYELIYKPQRFVLPGLLISTITLISYIIILRWKLR